MMKTGEVVLLVVLVVGGGAAIYLAMSSQKKQPAVNQTGELQKVGGALNATVSGASAVADRGLSSYGSAVGKAGSISTRVGLATVSGGLSEIPQVRNVANKAYNYVKFW